MAEEIQKPTARAPRKAAPKVEAPAAPKAEAPKVEGPKSFRVKIVGTGAMFIGGALHLPGSEVEVSEAAYKLSADDQIKIFGQTKYLAQ